jgi:hypothetical protein
MTSATNAETMIGENEQKKSLVFNLFKFRGGDSHTPGNSIFSCQNKHAIDISGG